MLPDRPRLLKLTLTVVGLPEWLTTTTTGLPAELTAPVAIEIPLAEVCLTKDTPAPSFSCRDIRRYASERSRIPLVCDAAGNIVWIPGVRRSMHAAVGRHTASVLLITLEDLEKSEEA